MKRCTYCGRENPDSAAQCGGCGTDLPASPPLLQREERLEPKLMTAEQVAEFFRRDGAFTRPDWDALKVFIEKKIPEAEQGAVWNEAVNLWVAALAEDLGGSYRVVSSRNFICLTDRDEAMAGWMLRFAEKAEAQIRATLRERAWGSAWKHVLLILTDEDDYDGYIAQFYHEGTFATTLGLQIRQGIPHIVVHFVEPREALVTVAHELSHACVSHLALPRWLDEALAQTLQKQIGDVPPSESLTDAQAVWNIQSNWTPPVLWDELAERHHEFWNEENIHAFWAGTLFFEPGDGAELSYSLAEILLNLIAQDFGNWLDFVARAHHDDAGQTAALDCFGKGLGEVAGTFLGPGDWQPSRQKLVHHWKAAGWQE
jgi:hypothetical protein